MTGRVCDFLVLSGSSAEARAPSGEAKPTHRRSLNESESGLCSPSAAAFDGAPRAWNAARLLGGIKESRGGALCQFCNVLSKPGEWLVTCSASLDAR